MDTLEFGRLRSAVVSALAALALLVIGASLLAETARAQDNSPPGLVISQRNHAV